MMRAPAFCIAVLIALLLSGGASALSAMLVPAVTTDGNGTMTTISARALAGDGGGVYVDVEPFVSLDTQNSGKTAAKIAAEKAGANLSQFAVLFRIQTDAEIVDGPSGGLAFTLLAYSEFTGRKLRNDMTATGTIELDGSVGLVGGVASKLEAAAARGVKLFLVPVGQSDEEGVDLAQLGGSLGVQVVEVANIGEAVNIAFTPAGTTVMVPEHPVIPLVLANITASRSAEALGLRWVAEKEFAEASADVAGLLAFLNESSPSIQAARRSLNLSRQLLDNGYYYSAANTVFLLKISAETMLLNYGKVSESDITDRIDSLLREVEAYSFTEKSTANWQWVVGGQLRWHWARRTLDLAQADQQDGVAPLIVLYRDYSLAKSWFSAAKDMDEWARGKPSSPALTEDLLRDLADQMLGDAQVAMAMSSDTTLDIHMVGAEESFDDGDYIASMFDSQFVISFTAADDAIRGMTATEVRAGLSNRTLASFHTYWGEEYFAHAIYNLAESNRSGGMDFLGNVVKLERLAEDIEGVIANVTRLAPATGVRVSGGPSGRANGAGSQGLTVSVLPSVGLDEGQRIFILVSVGVIVAGILVLALVIRSRWPRRKTEVRLAAGGSGTVVDRLDELLLEKRISEATYLRLRAKYGKGSEADRTGARGARAGGRPKARGARRAKR